MTVRVYYVPQVCLSHVSGFVEIVASGYRLNRHGCFDIIHYYCIRIEDPTQRHLS